MNTSDQSPATVGVLHPGQMGAAVAAQLRRNQMTVLWCPAGRSTTTADRAARADLHPVPELSRLLERAEVVLSICPPADAEDLAGTVAQHDYSGVYVDANAISPTRTRRIAETLGDNGATVIDGAIIGPPPKDNTQARLYLSGDPTAAAATVASLFTDTAVHPVVLDGQIGTASGLKMAYAAFQKASRALAGVAHALAADLGVTENLLAEAERNPRSPLTDPDYLPSVAACAWRGAPELQEVADTLTTAGLPPDSAHAAAAVLERWNADKDRELDLDEALAHLRRPAP